MDAIIAVERAAQIALEFKSNLKPELAGQIKEEQLSIDYWMDRISPSAWFATDRELIGFVYSVLMTTLNKETLKNIKDIHSFQTTKHHTITPETTPDGICELQVLFTRKSHDRIKYNDADSVSVFCRNTLYPAGSIQYSEQFYVLLLNRQNQLFAYKLISSGGITATHTDPKLIFQTALLCHATQIILVHNHPSGNRLPSSNDIELTKRLKQLGELMDLHVLDHVIIVDDGYYSFADEGML